VTSRSSHPIRGRTRPRLLFKAKGFADTRHHAGGPFYGAKRVRLGSSPSQQRGLRFRRSPIKDSRRGTSTTKMLWGGGGGQGELGVLVFGLARPRSARTRTCGAHGALGRAPRSKSGAMCGKPELDEPEKRTQQPASVGGRSPPARPPRPARAAARFPCSVLRPGFNADAVVGSYEYRQCRFARASPRGSDKPR
jgi:hypothetical protein